MLRILDRHHEFGIVLYLPLRPYSNINMFLFILYIVCSSSIFDIVIINNKFISMFTKRLTQILSELSGRLNVSVVLICYLPMDASYFSSHVVDRRCDIPVESFIVHSLLIGLVE
jgi:hypothetical protein